MNQDRVPINEIGTRDEDDRHARDVREAVKGAA
jgi:hypothetical protein